MVLLHPAASHRHEMSNDIRCYCRSHSSPGNTCNVLLLLLLLFLLLLHRLYCWHLSLQHCVLLVPRTRSWLIFRAVTSTLPRPVLLLVTCTTELLYPAVATTVTSAMKSRSAGPQNRRG